MDIASSTQRLQLLAKQGSVPLALEVLRSMPVVDLVVWNIVLATNAAGRNLWKTKLIFETMPERNLVSANTMLSAILTAAEDQEMEMEAAENFFYEEMQQRDIVSYNAMLNAYAKRGLLNRARELFFSSMPELDVVAVTTIISVVDLDHARVLFDSIRDRDELCWNAMLCAYARSWHIVEARDIFDSMPVKIVSSWNSMLCAYIQVCDLDSAEKFFFLAMPEWNLFACTAMLAAYSQHGHLSKAGEIFSGMPEASLVSWTALLDGYARNGFTRNAVSVFHSMPEKNYVAWSIMVFAFARQLSPKTDEFFVVSDISVWNSLLACCAQFQNASLCSRKAFQILSSMNCQGLSPDENTFLPILLACSRSGQVDAARRCFSCLTSDFFVRPSKKLHSCLIDTLRRAAFRDDARDLALSMPFKPDSVDLSSIHQLL